MHPGSCPGFCSALPGSIESADEYAVPARGRIRTDHADVILPSLIARHGLALLPEFLVWDALRCGEFERVMCDRKITDVNLNLITPPRMQRAARVTALLDLLVEYLAHAPLAKYAC